MAFQFKPNDIRKKVMGSKSRGTSQRGKVPGHWEPVQVVRRGQRWVYYEGRGIGCVSWENGRDGKDIQEIQGWLGDLGLSNKEAGNWRSWKGHEGNVGQALLLYIHVELVRWITFIIMGLKHTAQWTGNWENKGRRMRSSRGQEVKLL